MYGMHGSLTVRKSLIERLPKSDLLAIPFVLSSAALLIQTVLVPSLNHSVRLDVSGWNWLSQIQLETEKADPSLIREWDEKISKPKEVAIRKQTLRFARQKLIYSKDFSKRSLLGKVPSVDHLVVSAAAPVPPKKIQSDVVDTMEKKKLLLVHRLISARLLIALNSPAISLPAIAVATQAIEPVVIPPTPSKAEILNTQNVKRKKISIHANRRIASISRPTFEPAAVTIEKEEEHRQKIASNQEWNTLIPDGYKRIAEETPVVSQPTQDERVELSSLGGALNDLYYKVVGDHLKGLQNTTTGEVRNQKSISDVESLVAAVSNFVEKPAFISEQDSLALNSVGAKNGYSNEYSSAAGLTTQVTTLSQPQVPGRSVAIANSDSIQVSLNHSSAPLESANQFNADKKELNVAAAHESQNEVLEEKAYIEALANRFIAVFGVDNEVISSEPSIRGNGRIGWQLASAKDHWATLYWDDSEMSGNKAIPLFHQNTIRSFSNSSLAGADQQAGAGIIFGKVAAGWRVEMGSGDVLGSSEPIYFDSQMQVVPLGQTESERTFALLNVNPGSRVLYLRSIAGNLSGGIAVPVLAGTSTFVNASEIKSDRSITGVLYDESEHSGEQLWPLSGSTVRIIGQASAVAVTDNNGTFQFSNVIYAGSYPQMLESYKVIEVENGVLRHLGYTHRYQVHSNEVTDLKLFRIARSQIKDWIHQIPSGMSHDSGLLVSAFTQVDEVDSNFKLLPNLFSIPTSAGLSPLAFTVSSTGYLSDSNFIRPDQNRVLGAQLPEGPVVFRLSAEHETGKVEWSTLFFAAPGVVNMVGPISLPKILNTH